MNLETSLTFNFSMYECRFLWYLISRSMNRLIDLLRSYLLKHALGVPSSSIYIDSGSTMSIPCAPRKCVSISHFLRYHLRQSWQYSTTIHAEALFPWHLFQLYTTSLGYDYLLFEYILGMLEHLLHKDYHKHNKTKYTYHLEEHLRRIMTWHVRSRSKEDESLILDPCCSDT